MSSSAAVVSVMLNAVSSMATVSLVSLVGVLCALYPTDNPLISPAFLQQIARLSSLVFLPALMIYVLGSGLSLKIISELGILIPFAFLISIISFVIANSVGKVIVRDDTSLRSGLIVCCCMPNSTSLPIMILKSACKQPEVNVDYESDQETCEAVALSMLFVYGIGWNIMFWSFARHELERCSLQDKPAAEEEEEADPEGRTRSPSAATADSIAPPATTSNHWEKLRAFFLSPPMLGIYIGIFVGICEPVQSLLFFQPFSPLAPLGDSIKTVGEPLICVSTLVMAASLAQVRIDLRTTSAYQLCAHLHFWLWSPVGSKDSAEAAHGVYNSVASGGGASVAEETATDPLATASLALEPKSAKEVQTELGCQVGPTDIVIEDKPKPSGVNELPPWNYFALHTLCRLILPPIVVLPLLSGAISLGIVPRAQRLLALVVVIESCVPSAQLILIVLNQYGLQEMATNISLMYLFHYLVSIFTITFWFSVGMLMIY
jgi:predicted permease